MGLRCLGFAVFPGVPSAIDASPLCLRFVGFAVFTVVLPGVCGQPLGSKILGFRCFVGVHPVLVASPFGLRFLVFAVFLAFAVFAACARCLWPALGLRWFLASSQPLGGVRGQPLGSEMLGFWFLLSLWVVFVASPLGLRFSVFDVFSVCPPALAAKPLGLRFSVFVVFSACPR